MSSLDTVFHSKLDSTVKGIVEKWFEDYKDIPEGYSSDFYYNHMSNRKNSNLGIPRLGEIIGNFKCVGKRSPWVDHNSGRGYQTSVSCLLAPASEAEIEADKKKKAKKVAQANKKAEEERQKMLEASQPLMDAPDKKEFILTELRKLDMDFRLGMEILSKRYQRSKAFLWDLVKRGDI